MTGTGSGANGELTREILRAELRAGLEGQENKFRQMLDVRLAPINEHIARVDRGELTPAQKASIVSVVEDSSDRKVERRNLKLPTIAAVIAAASLLATIGLTFAAGFHLV